MYRFTAFCILLFLCLNTLDGEAQDDKTPWWKNLFKKETVDEMNRDEPTTGRPIDPKTTQVPDTPFPVDSMMVVDEASLIRSAKPGIVRIYQDSRILSIDSLYTKEPPAISGYRIKIYFGDLNTARSERARYISSHKGEPCYLRPYPPNFAVLVGDYRTSIKAHRRMAELKAMYPSASVVQDEIQLPALEN